MQSPAMSPPFNVLILCTGNSARSILSEVLFNDLAQQHNPALRAYSAGSKPTGCVNPFALATLTAHGHAIEGLSSKSWDNFSAPGAPTMAMVVTVCDNAAGEICPLWPGDPIKAHWSYPDPAAMGSNDTERRDAFENVYQQIHARIAHFLARPVTSMTREALAHHARHSSGQQAV